MNELSIPLIRPFYAFDREKPYHISSEGAVFNQYAKPLSKQIDKDGYEYVLVRSNGHRKKFLVHRLVADAFIPNPGLLPQVNHIDGNKRNNRVSNLEWVTNSENQIHSRYILGNQTGFKDTPVVCVETGTIYKSTRDAWRDTGVCYSHISECANGKRKTAGSYHWKSVNT